MSKNINNNKIEEEEEYYIPDIVSEIDDFNIIDNEIFNEINKVRQSPEEYVKKLEDTLKQTIKNNDNCLFLRNIPFYYNNLNDSLKNAIIFLKSQKKMPNLEYSLSISYGCEDLLFDYVNNPNYDNNKSNYEKRLREIGQPYGENYEIINYDIFDAEFLILNLILGDGDISKFGRKVLFNKNLKYIGIISGLIPPNKFCSILNFSEDFYEIDTIVPNEIKNKYKKNIFETKTIIHKRAKNILKEADKKNINEPKAQNKDPDITRYKIFGKIYIINKKDNNNLINKNADINKNNNIVLKNPPNKMKSYDKLEYDLENFDEEEFFEKEFDTNYGKYEKDKNYQKKLFTTSTTTDRGVPKTIITKIVETVDKNRIKRGYYIEKEENRGNIDTKWRRQEHIEKEKRDMQILKDMEKKEKERIQKEKNNKRIKEIPIKLKGKKGEDDGREYFEEDANSILDGAYEMKVQRKPITDWKGKPAIEIKSKITYDDGSVQQFVDNQPLENYENE